MITTKQAVEAILSSHGGSEFTCIFIKRTTGEEREMRFALSNPDYVPRGEEAYNPREKGLIRVWDLDKLGWRSIPEEGLLSLKIGDTWHDVGE